MQKNHGRKQILLVDDEQPIRESIKMLLEIDDYEVVEAESAERALSLIQKREFDIVLTDFRMGKGRMTGGDLGKAIKEQAPRTPVVLVTGFHDAVNPEVFDATLYKPFTLDELRKAIRKLLGRPRGT